MVWLGLFVVRAFVEQKVAKGTRHMEISIHEFKKDLAKLLSAAEKGEKVVVTRYGKPIVELRPAAKIGGFEFSSDDPDRAEFDLDGPVVSVNLDVLDDGALSREVLALDKFATQDLN